MAIEWSCDPHLRGSDYWGGEDSPGYTIWPDCAICSGLSRSSGHLINAASDLLEVARIAASMLGGDDTGPDDEDMRDVWEKVHRAIAKAEGRPGC